MPGSCESDALASIFVNRNNLIIMTNNKTSLHVDIELHLENLKRLKKDIPVMSVDQVLDVLYALGFCSKCGQYIQHDIDEPFSHCGCGTSEDVEGPKILQVASKRASQLINAGEKKYPQTFAMYDMCFSVPYMSEDVTPEALREAIESRLNDLADDEMLEACGLVEEGEKE